MAYLLHSSSFATYIMIWFLATTSCFCTAYPTCYSRKPAIHTNSRLVAGKVCNHSVKFWAIMGTAKSARWNDGVKDKKFQAEVALHITTKGDIDPFVRQLKSMATSTISSMNIDAQRLSHIYSEITAWLDVFDATQLSDCIWSCGKLCSVDTSIKYRELHLKMVTRFCEMGHVTGRQVTTSFGGIAKLHLRWNDLTLTLQNGLIALINQVCSTLNDREVGNLLHSMSKMGIPWYALPHQVQTGLLQSLIECAPRLLSQQGSMSIYSLGLSGLALDNTVPAVRDNLYLVAVNVLTEAAQIAPTRATSQQTSNVIYGLAKLGVQFAACPEQLRQCLLTALLCLLPHMNEQEVANTIYSISLMGLKWCELPVELQHLLDSSAALRYPRMITQGVSNTLYGLGVMGVAWADLSPGHRNAVYDAIRRCFSRGTVSATVNSQAVSNVVYALGLCGAQWSDFPAESKRAVMEGIVICSSQFKSQEIANLIYGLGSVRADFDHLPPSAVAALTRAYLRVSPWINEQEVCSCLHGLAKMNAQWSHLPENLRAVLLDSAVALSELGSLCLACTIYSLGLLGARWETLPPQIGSHIVRTAQSKPLSDQTLSNTLYGLSLMGADWELVDPTLRSAILRDLARPTVLSADHPQHISNTLWALGKMDATWHHLPGANLERCLLRCIDRASHQEVSNMIYGLAKVDVSWAELSLQTIKALEVTILKNIASVTVQETANIMYSLVLMTFDFQPDAQDSSKDQQQRMHSLWAIHEAVVKAYKAVDPRSFEREHYDQFAIYFELMRILPRGRALILSQFPDIPNPSGPGATVPSKMHALTVHAMMSNLHAISDKFSCFNEFCGIRGVFPMDAAVYFEDTLLALVEVDGEFHYKAQSQQLRRKDQLKEALYRYHYPTTPIYRLRSDQLNVIGYAKAGAALAEWIASDPRLSTALFKLNERLY